MSPSNPPVPVVSYARISADLRRDEHGVQDQHRVNRQTAERYGWTVVHEFTDNDKSAAKEGVVRDDFEAMLRALRAGKLPNGTPVQGVVIVAEDRLARRPGDYERFVEAITFQDGRVFADARGSKDLYSEDVESMGLFGAVISKMEVRKMQRRMRRSHRSRAEEGRPSGGPRPFGWNEDRLTLNEREADLLRQAAKDFLAGHSLHSIIRGWQALGVKTSLGNDWAVASLKVALKNPRICGLRELGGELVRDAGGEPIRGKWAAIITEEEWAAIRAVFNARKGHFVTRDMEIGKAHPPDYRDPTYLLSAIIRCGRPRPDGTLCNTPLRVNVRKNATHHDYTCRSKAEGGCGGLSRRGDLVDEYVSEAVLAKLEERSFAASAEGSTWDGEAKLESAKERLEELTRQWNTGKISNDLFFKLAPGLEKEIARLRTERANLAASAELRQARANTDVAEIRRRWYLPERDGGLPISTKRAYIREALHTVIIHPIGRGQKIFNPDLLEPIWRED
ncbi:recombinase family protein [Streptosporangium sandarakinum]|uniref:DNA invertase Pin-like site-specific DNA recombinase n=1 Tax=Streptosporangium sandarakinum TaxID=1260955 RepID=A0A852V8A2_9ACTN|nr:recombinase family protein [Streptosporangium sandarakinum]NYF43788.1 DNA invertase Pin-like site-specific DNA recombinase [Streptosporangium sandarakinum]